jgi:hypothetical protein
MAKKRFKAGMESLFEDHSDPIELNQDTAASPEKKAEEKTTQKSSGKGFRNDLKSFLQEAFEESLEQQLEQKGTTPKKKPVKPKGGLDALLRSTIEPSKMRLQNKPVRRLTISFDEDKLAKLKQIARKERTYLKDIIDEIVGEFLASYDEE